MNSVAHQPELVREILLWLQAVGFLQSTIDVHPAYPLSSASLVSRLWHLQALPLQFASIFLSHSLSGALAADGVNFTPHVFGPRLRALAALMDANPRIAECVRRLEFHAWTTEIVAQQSYIDSVLRRLGQLKCLVAEIKVQNTSARMAERAGSVISPPGPEDGTGGAAAGVEGAGIVPWLQKAVAALEEVDCLDPKIYQLRLAIPHMVESLIIHGEMPISLTMLSALPMLTGLAITAPLCTLKSAGTEPWTTVARLENLGLGLINTSPEALYDAIRQHTPLFTALADRKSVV